MDNIFLGMFSNQDIQFSETRVIERGADDMIEYTTSIEGIEADLAFEFALCAPDDVKGAVGEEIERIVKCAEAGETRIDSPYLDAVIIID